MYTHKKHWREALATVVIACALWQAAPVQAAAAAQPEPSADDRACLDCHGPQEPRATAAAHARRDLEGRKIPRIEVAAYLSSVHGDAGCISCHDEVKLPAHPGKAQTSDERPRKAPGAVIPMCRGCHAKVVKAFDRSIHAEAVRARSRSAPDCNGCHVPHAVTTASVQEGTNGAQREILTSAITVEALKGFYALGGTRLAALDLVLALGLFMGISVPALHLLVRRVLARPHPPTE